MRINPLITFLIATVTATTLASCDKAAPPEAIAPAPTSSAMSSGTKSSDAKPSSSPAMANATAGKITDAKVIAGFTTLQGVVSKTQTALDGGKFDQAKTEFDKFETTWKIIEDTVGKQSTDTYVAVEKDLKAVETAIEGKDKAAAMTALTSLKNTLTLK
jgi:hypothetical protein